MKKSELKKYVRENIISELSENTEDEIAKTKEPDLTAASLDAAVNTIAGSARSMGLVIEG